MRALAFCIVIFCVKKARDQEEEEKERKIAVIFKKFTLGKYGDRPLCLIMYEVVANEVAHLVRKYFWSFVHEQRKKIWEKRENSDGGKKLQIALSQWTKRCFLPRIIWSLIRPFRPVLDMVETLPCTYI
jgi:hypothetical protein